MNVELSSTREHLFQRFEFFDVFLRIDSPFIFLHVLAVLFEILAHFRAILNFNILYVAFNRATIVVKLILNDFMLAGRLVSWVKFP